MRAEFVNISPKVAEVFLKSNKKNRPLSERRVFSYSKQMKSNEWKDTGDPIRFAKSGKLIDGQHRLHAIIKSGKTMKMQVMKGLEEDAGDVIDTGKARSAKDVLAMNGFSASTNLSGAAKFILLFEAGRFHTTKGTLKNYSVSNANILTFVRKHKDLVEMCTFCQQVYSNFKVPGAISAPSLTALYYILAKKNQIKVDEFFEKYGTGAELKTTSPIFLLREKFIKEGGNKRKLPPNDKVALFIIAWNAFLTNKPMEVLKFQTGQPFPKPL